MADAECDIVLLRPAGAGGAVPPLRAELPKDRLCAGEETLALTLDAEKLLLL